MAPLTEFTVCSHSAKSTYASVTVDSIPADTLVVARVARALVDCYKNDNFARCHAAEEKLLKD